jgi:hypothetical protein
MNNNIDDILTRLQGQQPVIDNPEELTDSIMQSLPEQDDIVIKEHKGRLMPIIWRWVAAAACLLIIIGIGVGYQFSDSPQPISQSTTVSHPIDHGQSVNQPRSVIQSTTTSQSIEHGQSVNRPRSVKQSNTVSQTIEHAQSINRTCSIEKTTTLDEQTKYAQQTNRVPQAQPLPQMLTERDIPITRPENYEYTPEEIALMKKQAREAYLKWVELELRIAKYNQEQTANNNIDL